MSTTVVDKFNEVGAHFNRKAAENTDEEDQRKYQSISKVIFGIALRLKSVPFKNNIIKECTDLFMRPYNEFYECLNTKDNILGFTNGIYDLDTGVFRAGQPDDLVTFSTRYAFPISSNHKIREYIQSFLTSISSSTSMKDFLVDILSYSAHGNKCFQDSNLHFWSGTGANGKGALKNLCMTTFGDYAYEPDPSIITTTKQDSSKVSPEMSKLKGKRFACMSEPETTQKLQVSLLKRLTGGDQLQSRELWRDAAEFKLSSTFILLMNTKPSLTDFDGGIARRLNVIDFPYKFVDSPRLSTERPIDHGMDKHFKDPLYAQEFILLLLENYRARIHNASNITKPIEVLAETTAYLDDNNVVKAFITRYLELTKNAEDMIQSSEMFDMFKYSECYNHKDKGWFKEQMSINGLKPLKKTTRGRFHKGMVYFGVKKTTLEEEEQEDHEDRL